MTTITDQFSYKTTKRLEEKGFENLERIAEKTEQELRQGGFNATNLVEIRQVLKEAGMKLAG